jgi:hypothetical protein
MLIPELAVSSHPGVAIRGIAGVSLERRVFAATRTADARRPSVRALLDAVSARAADA